MLYISSRRNLAVFYALLITPAVVLLFTSSMDQVYGTQQFI